jgi:hypothetical protein
MSGEIYIKASRLTGQVRVDSVDNPHWKTALKAILDKNGNRRVTRAEARRGVRKIRVNATELCSKANPQNTLTKCQIDNAFERAQEEASNISGSARSEKKFWAYKIKAQYFLEARKSFDNEAAKN